MPIFIHSVTTSFGTFLVGFSHYSDTLMASSNQMNNKNLKDQKINRLVLYVLSTHQSSATLSALHWPSNL